MELFETIYHRRSIRKYADRPIPTETVKAILQAAMMAPSAGNAQPWQFILMTDRDKLAQVKAINPYAAMAGQAPMGIVVCGDLSLEKYTGFWVQDCSAAMQNLLLAAHAEGLGAVWTGIYPIKERVAGFRALLDLPQQIIPLGMAVMGYPAQALKSTDRYQADRIHHNRWAEPWAD